MGARRLACTPGKRLGGGTRPCSIAQRELTRPPISGKRSYAQERLQVRGGGEPQRRTCEPNDPPARHSAPRPTEQVRRDMKDKYKETARGRLAVNLLKMSDLSGGLPEC